MKAREAKALLTVLRAVGEDELIKASNKVHVDFGMFLRALDAINRDAGYITVPDPDVLDQIARN